MPDWVHVWFWLRFLRDPQVMTPLPQQEWHPEAMSQGVYEKYENEWVQTGAPQTTTKQVLLAMGAVEDDGIPF